LLVPHSAPPVSPSIIAALLLTARNPLQRLGLPAPAASEILRATGAGRSRAYALSEAIKSMLPSLQRPVGRPTLTAAPQAPTERAHELTLAVLRFVTHHPGVMSVGAERAQYADAFRRHIVELRQQYSDLELDLFARATDVPLGTIKGWLSTPITDGDNELCAPSESDESALDEMPARASTSAQIETVLVEWKHWHGGFIDFCDHIQHNCRVPLGRTAIAAILEAEGVRVRTRRPGRSPDEQALRGSFETFFPGAQWVGDGSQIAVVINHERFELNFELMVDAYSGAFVGLSVRETEDSIAVTEAFDSGIETAGEPPIALLLDNRPSNHAPEVDEQLGEGTLRMRSTLGRAQNKAPVEGAFGLFSQTVPALVIAATSPRQIAEQILSLVVTTWARAMNQRPRRDRDGRSRADLYTDKPTEEQLAQARAALLERHRKQELARRTLLARQDQNIRALLDDAFARLGLADPEHHFSAALARYGRDAIIEGVAIFESKRSAATLPPGVDARYLLGIVKNIASENELHELTEALIASRLAARELALRLLEEDRRAAEELHTEPARRIAHHADRAATSERKIDRHFWLAATGDAIVGAVANDFDARADWLRFAAARINVTTALPPRDRGQLVRALARHVLPIV
jgi:hypothetical protein